ncbi:terpene synthase family protein [Wenjunlia tyrosinilytica]|uniref:Terpenoid synthase n=1 Tax=Wenjunlia tyrosinilytica TaxID=1544741 RepID=A0A917ZSY6_9ACTN|nr:terpene synthase family protein [Wenjunlia tyrosinilytica]GGO93388.1 hypothetical protein GCM10012280_45810 [Wenjunlia tyrosinilytica]
MNDHLAAYEPRLVDELHAEVFHNLARWSLASCTCGTSPERHVEQSYIAATFCAFCLPPHASLREALIAAKCCLLFFLVDDGSTRLLSGFVDFLEADTKQANSEPAQCLVALLDEMTAHDCGTEDLKSNIHEWAVSMAAEQDLVHDSVAYEDHYTLRKHTIFVSCLVSCWISLLGIDLSSRHSSVCDGLVDLAIRMVILANDLGSINTDSTNIHSANTGRATPGHNGTLVDINSVLLRSSSSRSYDQAVLEAISQYNSYVIEFRKRARLLLNPSAPPDSQMEKFLPVVRNIVNGNLAGTRHLVAERYEGSSRQLSRLHLI